MIVLTDLFDPTLLAAMLDEGYVRTQTHPALPLRIFNYSEKAAYEGVWNQVTLTCRGLIVDDVTGKILARPFRKFFNYGQTGMPDLDLDAEVVVTDKMDGSLGILYSVPGGYAVATRGSFASEQAVHATQVWQECYAGRIDPPAGYTMLFEIVYPTNRIVVDYGDLDDLVLLGAVEISTGRSYSAAGYRPGGWDGPVAATFDHGTFAEALAAEPRPNSEGLVVHFLDADERIKLKQADYVALHRIVTGLTARVVWEHMVAGKPLAELIEPLPDEFHPWVRDIAGGLETAVQKEVWRLEEEFARVRDAMPDNWRADRAGRATFAAIAAKHPDNWAMFRLLDGKDIRSELLKRAKPEPYLTPAGRTFTEDNA